jgi:beta-lactamase superfamily II metal-dependent hydrolase
MKLPAVQLALVMLALCRATLLAAPGLLEIHQINVQQGDCTLVVGPNGTTVLIDAGNTGKGTAEVVPYLRGIGITPEDGLDFLICTHRDADHLGGIDEVIAAGYDITQGVWDNGSTRGGDPDSAIGQFLNRARMTAAGRAAGTNVPAIPLGHVIELGDGATATCVAVGGRVISHGSVTGATSENDMSVAMLVRFGDFEYLTAGDLGGGDTDRSCTDRVTDQANVESPLAIALRSGSPPQLSTHGLEVLYVNHHGSESSSNSDYMNLLTPTVAVINTGPGQGGTWHHPRIDVVESVLMAQVSCVTAPPAFVLQTEEGGPDGPNRSEQGFSVGDIVIKTTGVGIFQVFATGEVSQGPDERAAAGITSEGRVFPLDGATLEPAGRLVISEIMHDPAAVSDTSGEWFEVFNPGTTPVDINGWTIRDDRSDRHVVTGSTPLLVPARGFFVLGRNGDPAQNGGYHADYVYTGLNLGNGRDEIELVNPAGQVIDRVAYTGTSPWPDPTGASMQLLSPTADNNRGDSWSTSPTRGGSFDPSSPDRGSPGD